MRHVDKIPEPGANRSRHAPTLEDAHRASEEVVAPTVEAPPKVVNLMEALRKSLDAVGTSKKKTAKATAKLEPVKRKRATG